jgi:hypothetical protein
MFLLRGEAALQNVVDGFNESCEGRGSEIPFQTVYQAGASMPHLRHSAADMHPFVRATTKCAARDRCSKALDQVLAVPGQMRRAVTRFGVL